MRYSIVNYQTVLTNPDFRIDAEFSTHPLNDSASKSKAVFSPLHSLLKRISSGHTPYKHDVSTGEVGFVTVECIGDLTLDESLFKHITKEQYEVEFKTNRVIENSVLCTIKRRICKSFPFIKTPDKAMAINQDVAFLMPNDNIDSVYLATYLCCKIGQDFADRLKTENMNPYISVANLSQLPIAVLSKDFQRLIRDIFTSSLDSTSKSHKAYATAEQILLSELGLLNWKPKHRLSFVKDYSDTQAAERIDGEYFQPIYTETEQHLRSHYSAEPLGKYEFLDITTGQYVDTYVNKNDGLPYIRGTDLQAGTVNIDNLVYINPINQIKSKKAEEGDVVVTRVGTIGLSARIPKECDGGTLSDNLIRIRIKSDELNSYYLALFLNTQLGKSFMIRHSRGSVQQRLNQETLKEILIPIVSTDIQTKIAETIIESYRAKTSSKHLLEIAKTGIEKAIEQNEASATKWIKAEVAKLGVALQ